VLFIDYDTHGVCTQETKVIAMGLLFVDCVYHNGGIDGVIINVSFFCFSLVSNSPNLENTKTHADDISFTKPISS